MTGSDEEMRLISVNGRTYTLPLSAGRPWADVYPNIPPPAEGAKIWTTPDGKVVTRPDPDEGVLP